MNWYFILYLNTFLKRPLGNTFDRDTDRFTLSDLRSTLGLRDLFNLRDLRDLRPPNMDKLLVNFEADGSGSPAGAAGAPVALPPTMAAELANPHPPLRFFFC